MESMQHTTDSAQPSAEERLSFDQHIQQLPASKQSVHRWLVWLVAAACVLTLGVFVYAIYTSIIWKSVGGIGVVLAWMYFFLAGAVAAFLFGLETLIVGATLPLPFKGSEYSYETGAKAVTQGWGLIGYGVVVTILVFVGIASVQAGTFSLDNWITIIVSLFVIIGLASGVLAVLRRILQSR